MEIKMRSCKRKTPTENDVSNAEVVKYVKALFKAARTKTNKKTRSNELPRTVEVTKEYLNALRRAVGRHIDPETAEVDWTMSYIVDPYDDDLNLPEELQCTGRAYFARCPGTNVWICFDHLPDGTVDKLMKKHKHKLLFPAGL
jgi:hypothetical protein